MKHLITPLMNLVHAHPAAFGTVAGVSLLFPFAFFIWDSAKHPEKYKEH